jgi:hypothetical protein
MIRRRPPTVLQAWLLAALLLAAQALGLAHRVGHAPGLGKAAVASAAGWSADHKAGSGDCRLVDQLAHADALCGPLLPATVAAPAHAAPQDVAQADGPAAAHRAALARGPPQG